MSKGDLLRAIYDDLDAKWYIDSDKRIGSRRFKKKGGEVYVEYVDRDGILLASAHEIHRYNEYPYVEFRNKDGDVKGKAFLEVNVVSDPCVYFYNYVGDKVGEKFFDKKKLDGILADYYKDTGGGIKDEPPIDPPPRRPPVREDEPTLDGSIGPVICVAIFMCAIFQFLFAKLYAYIDTTVSVTRLVSLFAFVPVMFLVHLAICHPRRGDSSALRRFRWLHMAFAACSFAILVALTYLDLPIPVPAVFGSGPMVGCFYFLISFVPTLVYGIFSGIAALIHRGRSEYSAYRSVADNSSLLVCLATGIFVGINQMVTLFVDGYVPGKFGNTIAMIIGYPFLILLVLLAGKLSRLPYRIIARFH